MNDTYRHRRSVAVLVILTIITGAIFYTTFTNPVIPVQTVQQPTSTDGIIALDALKQLDIKGRSPKTDYSRDQFGSGWETTEGCDTRNIILNRDLTDAQVDSACNVSRGILHDPYTGKVIQFVRGSGTSSSVQIDHVVALSNAWQTGAGQLTLTKREALANDPLELLAVDGPANQQKSDGDAATWLPPYKAFRCQYVARQIAVKIKYHLWVTSGESDAIKAILQTCPTQQLPSK
jgi:hypothetical protein